MRTLVTIICLIIGIGVEAQNTNEYSSWVKNFCYNHKGQDVNGKGCNELVLAILEKTKTHPVHRFSLTDSTSHLGDKINVGDYVYMHLWKNQFGYGSGCHYAVVVGIDTVKKEITVAEQNVHKDNGRTRVKGVHITTFNYITSKGELEVYGLEKGELPYYTAEFTTSYIKKGKRIPGKPSTELRPK